MTKGSQVGMIKDEHSEVNVHRTAQFDDYDDDKSGMSSSAQGRRSTIMHFPPAIDPTLGSEERRSLLSGECDARVVSLASVTFNFAKTAMGVGILSIAGTFALSGLAVGLGLVVMSACLACFAAQLMLDAARVVRASTYEQLCEVTLGSWARVVIQCSLVIVLFFALVAYLVVSKNFLHSGIKEWGLDIDGRFLLIFSVAVVLPLTMLKNLDSLRYLSLFGIAMFFLFVGASFVWLIMHRHSTAPCEELHDHPKSGHPVYPNRHVVWVGDSWQDILNSFNVIAMSFSWHPAVFPVAEEVLQYDHPKTAHRKLSIGSLLAGVVLVMTYSAAGVVGYFQWYDTSPWASSILACYPASQPIFIVLYFAMALVCLVSFPLLLHFIRLIIANIMYKGETNDMPPCRRNAFNVAFTVGVAILGVVLNNLITVFSVGGALGLPLMCFLMPPLCYLQSVKMSENGLALEDAPPPSKVTVVGAKLLFFFGILLQFASLYTAGRSLVQGNT
eukprot:Hpha_TRINITY_DN14450_c0_g2::TRINITY_DN14450_c0_g2_i1::g.158095::m.158095/K14990/SLC38A1, SNAT1, GLNT; solute carrier family 38 (sodium-coupled neutral amino acid transporter), member 1